MPSLSVTNFCYLLFFNFCNLIEIVILKPNDPSISAIVTKKPNRGTEVEVILKRGYLLSNVSDSEILKISGTYWPESSQENAKGAIKLLHWCSSGDFSYDGPWVALFRDEPYPTCVTSFNSIERAILKGAEAVVIYLPRNKSILDQLKSPGSKRVNKPVVLLHSKELPLLSDLSYVDHDEGLNPEVPLDKTLNQDGHRDYYTISIFLGTLLVLSLISIAAILKFKGRWHKKEPCATQIAKRVLKSMETRKFNFTDHWFFTESCAVCLEEYIPGQEVRILPCRHEFHKSCVDGWLINRRTCPLCLSNILDRPNGNRDGYIYTSKQPPTHARAGASSGAVPGNYRRRYEFADESAETDHLGYIQQGFYRHSEEAGCVYAGYPSNTYEGISIAAPYEDSHPIGPATQAIVSNPPDQMVVSCNNPRTDEVDSASEEVGAPMCRSNFGFDRLVMRDRHRRFSCRRSAPSNSSPALYWGVGGLRSLRARRAILPEYSRLRIKLRQSHSEKNKNASSSLIVNNNTSSVGVLQQQQQQQQQQQSSSPIASNLSQLKVLPQQHSHQRLFYTDGTDGSKHPDKQQVMPPHFVPIQVTSLSLKQSTTLTPAPIHPLTTATEATFTQTLPKCKKQLVSNNLNNSNTHNNSNNGGMLAPASTSNNDNATICYNKRRRPPCCSLDDEDEFIWRSSSTFSTVLALNSGSYRSAIKLGCINKLSELSNVHCNNNSDNGNNNNKSLVISNFGGCCRLAKLNHHKQGDKDNPACSSNNTACQLNTANPNKPCNMPDNSNNNNTVNCCEELNFQAVDNNINNTNNANNNKNKDHYHYCCFGDQRCSIASSSSHYHTLPGRRPRHSHHHRHHHHHLHQLHQPSNKQQHQQQQQKQQKHDVDNLKKDKHLCDQKETKGKHVSYNNVNNNNISNNNTSNNNTSTNNGNDQSSKTIMKSTRILNASELDSYKLNNNNNNNNNHNINNNNNNNVNNNVNINIGNSSKTYKGKEASSILFDQSNSPFQSPLVAPVSSCSFVPMTTSSSLFHSLCHLSNTTPPSKNSFVDANAHKAGLCNNNNVAINNNAGNIGYNMLPLSVRVVQRASHKNTASSLSRLPSLQPPSHPSPCQLPPCQPPPPPPSLLSTGSASTGKVKKPKLPTPQQFLTHQKASAREASNFPLSRSLGREVVGAFVEGCLDCQRGLEMAVEGATRRNNNSALLAGRYCKNTADPPPLTTDSPSAHMEF